MTVILLEKCNFLESDEGGDFIESVGPSRLGKLKIILLYGYIFSSYDIFNAKRKYLLDHFRTKSSI